MRIGLPPRRVLPGDDLALRWSNRFSLTHRILAVNVFALVMLAGVVVYLDSFRDRLLEERSAKVMTSTRLMAETVGAAIGRGERNLSGVTVRLGEVTGARVRLFDASGRLAADSWQAGPPTFELRDPATQPWRKHAARFLDAVIEFFAAAEPYPAYAEPEAVRRDAWPEAAAARLGQVGIVQRRAADGTVIISAAAPVSGSNWVLLTTSDTRDVTRVVREERLNSFLIFLGVLALTLALSLFLARTIVRPLRRLAIAAQRVKLGRAREVTVPRLPKRRDEIGMLARALSDMTLAVRQRTDAVEAFAADVSHELKNPLASLRGAVESMDMVKDPALQAQLLDVIRDDVLRIDRLITDIAEVSRLDAELERTRFERIDMGQLLAALVAQVERSGLPRGVELAYARPEPGSACVMGDGSRLAQLARNLIDNAVSFSPDHGVVRLVVQPAGDRIVVRVDDDGPGIPPENIADIFKRFYSERPDGESFGKHSGLGLAIVAAVARAHDGTIEVVNRNEDGRITGARFTVSVPAA